MKKKIVIVTSVCQSLINFRKELIILFIKQGYEVVAIASNHEDNYIKKLTEMGVVYHEIPINVTGLNPLKDIIGMWKLIQLLRNYKPDIFFAYTVKPIVIGTIAARMCKIKRRYSMLTGLGYLFGEDRSKKGLIKNLAYRIFRLALNLNHRVIFQNKDDLNELVQKNFINREKTALVNGSGINLKKYSSKGFTLNKDEIVFLTMTRLIRDKGIYQFVEAAKNIKNKYPKTRFFVLGGIYNSPNAVPKDQVGKWVSDGIIEYYGKVNDVIPFLSQAHIYVLASYYREGIPRSILEAMAMSKVIITTNMPGCKETVTEGLNGYLVPPRDSIALANAMEKCILNQILLQKMGEESLNKARNRFNVDKVNEMMLTLLDMEIKNT